MKPASDTGRLPLRHDRIDVLRERFRQEQPTLTDEQLRIVRATFGAHRRARAA